MKFEPSKAEISRDLNISNTRAATADSGCLAQNGLGTRGDLAFAFRQCLREAFER